MPESDKNITYQKNRGINLYLDYIKLFCVFCLVFMLDFVGVNKYKAVAIYLKNFYERPTGFFSKNWDSI